MLAKISRRRAVRAYMTGLWLTALMMAALEAAVTQTDLANIRIGVLAFRGIPITRQMWQPTVDYLNREIPGYLFELVPLDLKEMKAAVADDRLDFVLTNTGNYVLLEARYGITRILTLRNLRAGQPYTVFGAVIFTRADRSDIDALSDLRGKSFGAVAKGAFGGFQMAWKAFLDADIDPFSDFSKLNYMGFPQDGIVFAVRDRLLDAGTVRTDTLERMAAQGLIALDEFKVLAARSDPDFPFLHSTALYPEWPFAQMPETSKALAKQVAIALLRLAADSEAAKAGKNAGWTVPLNYEPVHELFRSLEVAPYENYHQVTFADLLRTYWYVFLILLMLIGFGVFHIIRVDRLVIARTRALKDTNDALKHEVAERTKQQAEMHRTTLQLRQREQEIKRHRDHLEELVERRTHELTTVNKELEAYSYSIAHDLRSPLRSVTSFSQILAEDAADKLDSGQLDSLQRIIRASKHMAELIDDILELSRITRKDLQRAQIDLSALVGEIMQHLHDAEPRRDVDIKVSGDINVKGDPNLIRVAMENLLGNAWKYTAKVDHATIEFDSNVQNNETVYCVRDNGIGFDMRYANKLFLAFQRLHSSTDYEGTGIGLATVQRIIHRHGGRIWANSVPGKGSSFYFTLE